MAPRRRVLILAFDRFQPLDVVGPAEVFAGAERLCPGSYDVVVASPDGGLVRSDSGIVALDTVPASTCGRAVDTVLVGGGFGARHVGPDDEVARIVRELAPRCRRVASICTGAFVLAAAGVLDGRRVATHWWAAAQLAQRYPTLRVDDDPIFVRDGNVWTSAGVTSGLDLALALVSDDLGDEVAAEIARWMVMFLRRPGGQAQFSTHLRAPLAADPPIRAVQDWLADHLADDLSVAALARRAGLSPRHFARRFREETGVTPAAHVEALRVEAAKQLLGQDGISLAEITRRCGFGTIETFHRAFRRNTGTTPDHYRQHVAPAPAGV
ncbi:GlxA family transcriptional regulator [Jiangella sp. DSM 45060]|uniref:GlxA family transcriptional regulator n=1 Tax=Jiangella sp. DSM 45060 TaxID=1798224 RepID=UPI00087A5186|nr:GlxA family transcriptional regulator [Jiangella sp. DSM 45060]SDT18207.1 Transcriptional regulator GlxA family, contains an amidase domain and an AraC-type DNA-binding HTH domain [Jiangella sp. DSM 45060]